MTEDDSPTLVLNQSRATGQILFLSTATENTLLKVSSLFVWSRVDCTKYFSISLVTALRLSLVKHPLVSPINTSRGVTTSKIMSANTSGQFIRTKAIVCTIKRGRTPGFFVQTLGFLCYLCGIFYFSPSKSTGFLRQELFFVKSIQSNHFH